jgi:two-component system sensor histidine kinase KdpD
MNTFQVSRRTSRKQAYGITVGVILLLSLGLWLLRELLTDANFSLIYLLSVLIISIQLGIGPSLAAAGLAFLCFNFLLVSPYYTFIVADPRELLDLLIFLVVAIISGQLAAYARQRATEEDVLLKLASAFNQLTDAADVHRVLQDVLRDDLAAESSRVLPGPKVQAVQPTTAYVLLEANGQIYGTLAVQFATPPTPRQLRTVMACAAQASAALQRIELTRQVQQSRTFEEADRLKTALLHAVSHDLRTPITIIKSSVNNLLTLGERLPPDEQRDILRVADHEADQLNAMVEDLLDISRLQAGALRLNKEWCSLEEIAGDVAANVWQRTHEERLALDFAADLPLLRCDYGLVRRALSNLVDNALRYEPAERQIIVRGEATADAMRVAIINHGPNIDPQERAQIGEPFYHGKDGHIGLGLAIAKGILEAHYGGLTIEDTPGGGATFICTLPRETDEAL